MGLLGRILTLSIPSICLIKGATIAAGGMLAFAHDYIFVKDSAVIAFNESIAGIPVPPGMMETIKRKHKSYKTFRDMILFSRKIN